MTVRMPVVRLVPALPGGAAVGAPLVPACPRHLPYPTVRFGTGDTRDYQTVKGYLGACPEPRLGQCWERLTRACKQVLLEYLRVEVWADTAEASDAAGVLEAKVVLVVPIPDHALGGSRLEATVARACDELNRTGPLGAKAPRLVCAPLLLRSTAATKARDRPALHSGNAEELVRRLV
jgi:hypothetical protein